MGARQLHGHQPDRFREETIRKLARSTRRPIEEVKDVYERELAKLEADARVTTYIEVFAERHTRDELNRH